MSGSPHRRRPAAPHPSSPAQPAQGSTRAVWTACAVLILAGIPFVLGKYFELRCPDAFDSGSYVYSAQHVLSGARVGFEEKPSAQAGTLLVNMLGVTLSGFNETGSKILQGLLQAAALCLLFFTVRRLYGGLAGAVSVIVASVYLSAPLIAKYGNVKEQFMIAFMVMGICLFILYRLNGKWWWAVLDGALLVWGPMFKQTGVSAIAAVILYTLAQALMRRGTWRRAGRDLLLLMAGAALVLVPIYGWYVSMGTSPYYWPYSFAFAPVLKLTGVELKYEADTGRAPSADTEVREVRQSGDSWVMRLLPGYVSDSWRLLGPAERTEAFHRVLRYYRLLILPIALALGSIVAWIVVRVRSRGRPPAPEEDAGRFVLLLAVWWVLDMAFVWISPHSYEQYYLPLNASGAMLGAYLIGLYGRRLRADRDKTRWVVVGMLGLLAVLAMSWPVFFGIARSPHSGAAYTDPRTGQPTRMRGYVQKWEEVRSGLEYPWEQVGEYIRQHSQVQDPIYVWGWVPGIYVQAQRMSPTPKAFEGTMHSLPPEQLAERVAEILAAFEKRPPRFIVDTYKRHFPFNRPPLELWPRVSQGSPLADPSSFLRTDPAPVRQYEALYGGALREKWPDEARRFEAMKPLRDYVMRHYRVQGRFSEHVLFQRES
ncbi:MAG: glycosyltransferase family 39 protein [Phycisphaerae bacterium]|nr:glycosyltransferase family 39 protein [Phycisphaerae bacterium]